MLSLVATSNWLESSTMETYWQIGRQSFFDLGASFLSTLLYGRNADFNQTASSLICGAVGNNDDEQQYRYGDAAVATSAMTTVFHLENPFLVNNADTDGPACAGTDWVGT
jgi:hypothetical protein